MNESTIFVQGACSDLTSGATVEVKGFRRTDDSVLATMVKFKSNGDDDGRGTSPSNSRGSSPGCPVHVRRVRSISATARSGQTGATNFLTPCATLANGQNVKVKGKATGNGKVKASEVQ